MVYQSQKKNARRSDRQLLPFFMIEMRQTIKTKIVRWNPIKFTKVVVVIEEYVDFVEPEEWQDEKDEIDCSWEQVYKSNRVK